MFNKEALKQLRLKFNDERTTVHTKRASSRAFFDQARLEEKIHGGTCVGLRDKALTLIRYNEGSREISLALAFLRGQPYCKVEKNALVEIDFYSFHTAIKDCFPSIERGTLFKILQLWVEHKGVLPRVLVQAYGIIKLCSFLETQVRVLKELIKKQVIILDQAERNLTSTQKFFHSLSTEEAFKLVAKTQGLKDIRHFQNKALESYRVSLLSFENLAKETDIDFFKLIGVSK